MENKIFARRLKLAKENKGCMNIDIAIALGVDKSQVTRYMAGSQPRGDRLARLSQYLGVSSDWLIGADVPEKYDTYTQQFLTENEKAKYCENLTVDELKVFDFVSRDDKLKERLNSYAQKLADLLNEEHSS